MLSKDKRLNLKKDFKWVASGKRLESKYLKLFIRAGENTTPKVGIATSKAYFKKAVERNRARRLTATAFEVLFERIEPRLNIIALPKGEVLNVKSSEVLLDLETVLSNGGNILSKKK